jgi:peptidyl-prolyl cis-trans isomerase D
VPELEAVKEKVLVDAGREEQQKAAEAAAKQFLEKVKADGSITAVGKQDGVEVRSVTLENRNKQSPELENDGSVVAAAFNLSLQKRFPEDIIRGKDRCYVIALKEKKLPAPEGYEVAKNNIIARLTNQKQAALYDSWLANLRANSDISISKKFTDQGA